MVMTFLKQSVTWDPNNLTEAQCIDKIATAMGIPYAKEIIDRDKAEDRIIKAVKDGHESVLEHAHLTLDCITNVETYKDFTRHRHCAFTIESTSFVKYNELQVIVAAEKVAEYNNAFTAAEEAYKSLLRFEGAKVARDILPQCTAARMYMTTNIREWRYIIGLRGDPNDNPLTIELRNMMWRELERYCGFFFPAQHLIADMAIPLWYKHA